MTRRLKSARRHPPGTTAPEFFSADVSKAQRFYLNLTPPANTNLAVVCGGCEHCTPDYSIHRPTFPFHCIEYVVRGRGRVKLRGRTHVLQPGSVFSYGPGIRQDITGDPQEPLVKYFVDFAGRRAGQLLRDCRLSPGHFKQIFPPHELQAVLDELIHCGLRGTRRGPELCVKLLECLAVKIAESRAPAGGKETLAFSTYEQCRQYIEAHFQQLRSLKQISAECHVNDAYLCRLFRRYDHQSPYQYLLRLKLKLAADLLQQPGMLVKQAAEQTGFDDPFHFSRAFKGVFGLSPDAFRQWR